jgi:hypothetical protein
MHQALLVEKRGLQSEGLPERVLLGGNLLRRQLLGNDLLSDLLRRQLLQERMRRNSLLLQSGDKQLR